MKSPMRGKFLRLALLPVCAGLSVCAQSSNASCPAGVAGPTMNWAAYICEMRVGTDVLDETVSACMTTVAKRDHVPSAPAEMCSVNRRYKTELCRERVADGIEKSLRVCLRSTESIPPEVSAGF